MTVTASIVGATFVTVMINGTTYTIANDHTNYAAIRTALKNKEYDTVENLINVAKSIKTFSVGKVVVDGGVVMYGDHEVKGPVVNRILDMIREGFDAAPMISFLENLMENPSKRAVDELYGFLEASALPITEDGHFLAYKKVRDDFKDFYTGTMDNSVGQVLEMVRNRVDEDKDRTCSYGLHFCSLSYLPHYHGGQGKVMIVKINPRDVVAVPSDYNNAKGRACRYEIIGIHTSETVEAFSSPVYRNTTPVVPKPKVVTPAPVTQPVQTLKVDPVVAPAKKVNPALVGYNAGLRDRAAGVYSKLNLFVGKDRDIYEAAYDKGYARYAPKVAASVASPAPIVQKAATSVVPFQAGSKQAELDVQYGRPYNDASGSYVCQASKSEYRKGYAEGWYQAKLKQN